MKNRMSDGACVSDSSYFEDQVFFISLAESQVTQDKEKWELDLDRMGFVVVSLQYKIGNKHCHKKMAEK